MANACNPNTRGVEGGGLGVPGSTIGTKRVVMERERTESAHMTKRQTNYVNPEVPRARCLPAVE